MPQPPGRNTAERYPIFGPGLWPFLVVVSLLTLFQLGMDALLAHDGATATAAGNPATLPPEVFCPNAPPPPPGFRIIAC